MRRLCIVMFTLLFLTGCGILGGKEKSKWMVSSSYNVSREKIWQEIKEMFSKTNYKPKDIDLEKGTLVTDWYAIIGVSLYESTRRRVHLRIEKTPESTYLVHLWVELQHNTEIAPLSRPDLLKWGAAGSDEVETERLMIMLDFHLREHLKERE